METNTQLGHYTVIEAIGKGGMGEVWKAHDTKLGREVAIKTLPEELAREGDRLARLEREAKVLASLNHPNIAGIYGLEEHRGVRFLVLELVEGATLAERIAQGPIPVDESLKYARQIAEALEAAHERGVIHRDLKPANIKVTEDGTVKVLDFGLAKALVREESEISASNSPTLSLAATQQGVILGTAAYMAPEQAQGRSVDKRADIWAFGCVVYEMLTGKRAFEGEDVSDTLASVLRSTVTLEALPEDTPPRLRQVLKACLQRDLRQRAHDIGDLRLALDGAFDVQETAGQTAARRHPASALGHGLGCSPGPCGHRRGQPRQLFESDWVIGTPPSASIDISPDGSRFVGMRFVPGTPEPVTQIEIVQNWFEELKRLVPTR